MFLVRVREKGNFTFSRKRREWLPSYRILVLNCAKFIMEVMLRKSLVLEIKKTQTSKTFMASKDNFNMYFSVLWSNFIKIVFFFQFILFD